MTKLDKLAERVEFDVTHSALMLNIFDTFTKIWLEHGAYQDGEISSDTWSRVRNLMGFDDSE